jgi:hypothetical protein
MRRHGCAACNRLRSSSCLLRPHHCHRPLHGPEGGKSPRLRAGRPKNSLVGGARVAHRCGDQCRHFLRNPRRGIRIPQLHLLATGARHDYRANPGQLHFHQTLLRLQGLLDLRISYRPLRRANEERGFSRVPIYTAARIRYAAVCRRHRAHARL